MSGNKFSNVLRFDVEKFDRNLNFGSWQVQVRNVLIQSRLHNALMRIDSVKESRKDSKKIYYEQD